MNILNHTQGQIDSPNEDNIKQKLIFFLWWVDNLDQLREPLNIIEYLSYHKKVNWIQNDKSITSPSDKIWLSNSDIERYKKMIPEYYQNWLQQTKILKNKIINIEINWPIKSDNLFDANLINQDGTYHKIKYLIYNNKNIFELSQNLDMFDISQKFNWPKIYRKWWNLIKNIWPEKYNYILNNITSEISEYKDWPEQRITDRVTGIFLPQLKPQKHIFNLGQLLELLHNNIEVFKKDVNYAKYFKILNYKITKKIRTIFDENKILEIVEKKIKHFLNEDIIYLSKHENLIANLKNEKPKIIIKNIKRGNKYWLIYSNWIILIKIFWLGEIGQSMLVPKINLKLKNRF